MTEPTSCHRNIRRRHRARAKPDRNASDATLRISGRASAGAVSATAYAAPMELRAAVDCAFGQQSSQAGGQLVAVGGGEERLPMTATPRVPPSSRVVSLTAEPTPAFSVGSEPMIDSVAGAM